MTIPHAHHVAADAASTLRGFASRARKDNQRDRGSPSAAPAPLAQILLALATSILGEAKVASADATKANKEKGKPMTTNITKKIRELNDAFRQHFPATGRRYITDGIFALDSDDRDAILEKVRTFDSFTPDNDPHGEHDFGSVDPNGERIFWKIDYYDSACQHGSEDPADPAKTVRVLTIMLAEEY